MTQASKANRWWAKQPGHGTVRTPEQASTCAPIYAEVWRRKANDVEVATSGVACAMGVGGRRHRRRRRAEERNVSVHSQPRWMRMRLPW